VNSYYLELKFGVAAPSTSRLDQHLDDLMDALCEEPGATDADVAAELTTGNVSISMYVSAPDDGAAITKALLVARSAIHKAGGFTGGWALPDETPGDLSVADSYSLRVQPAELIDC